MGAYDDIQRIKDTLNGLDNNPVSNFAYTKRAFENDNVNGVEAFDSAADQNIPKASCTDYNQTVLQKGARTQAASIPRNAWNHFIGRMSYNLNKLVQLFGGFHAHIVSSSAHNCFEYNPASKYRQGDVCYAIHAAGDRQVISVFRREMSDPAELQGVPPLSDADQWKMITDSGVFALSLDVNALDDVVSTEITDRKNAVKDEADARIKEDDSLGDRITSEAAERERVDTALLRDNINNNGHRQAISTIYHGTTNQELQAILDDKSNNGHGHDAAGLTANNGSQNLQNVLNNEAAERERVDNAILTNNINNNGHSQSTYTIYSGEDGTNLQAILNNKSNNGHDHDAAGLTANNGSQNLQNVLTNLYDTKADGYRTAIDLNNLKERVSDLEINVNSNNGNIVTSVSAPLTKSGTNISLSVTLNSRAIPRVGSYIMALRENSTASTAVPGNYLSVYNPNTYLPGSYESQGNGVYAGFIVDPSSASLNHINSAGGAVLSGTWQVHGRHGNDFLMRKVAD